MKHPLPSALLVAGFLTGFGNPLLAATASRHALGLIDGLHASSYGDSQFAYGNHFEHTFSTAAPYAFGDAFASGNGVSGGSGYADVGFGWIRMSATVSSSSGANPDGISFKGIPHDNGGEATITFVGSFTDVLTIDHPLLTDHVGTIGLDLRVDGAISPRVDASGPDAGGLANGVADACAIVCTRILTTTVAFGQDEPVHVDDFDLGGRIGFVFGKPFTLKVELVLRARAAAASNGGASVTATTVNDFAHTLAWQGMTDLRDEEGNPIEDFGVTSASGTDYRLSIAPPAAELRPSPVFPPGTPWQCAPNCAALTPVPLPPAAISLVLALSSVAGLRVIRGRGKPAVNQGD